MNKNVYQTVSELVGHDLRRQLSGYFMLLRRSESDPAVHVRHLD